MPAHRQSDEFKSCIDSLLRIIKINMLSNFDQINFSACKVGAHKNQPLSRVCVDKNCEQRSFICYTCEQEIHLGHRTLALKEFL